MDHNQAFLKHLRKMRKSVTEVVNPNRSICEDHSLLDFSERVRFGISKEGIAPPSAANRRAASRSMSASSPILTSAVFSVSPVYSPARASKGSSMLSVVRICMSMHVMDAFCQFLNIPSDGVQ